MNKDDFYKYLKQNNLDGVYEIGKYFTENYSLGNAVSLLAEPYEPIFNAYDILKKGKNITINCGRLDNQNFYFQLTRPDIIAPYRGYFRSFVGHENDAILSNKENEYFYADIQPIASKSYSQIITVNLGLAFIQETTPPLKDIYNTDNTYKDGEEYVQGQYFYADGYFEDGDPEPIIVPNIWGLFPKMNAFLNTKTKETQLINQTEYTDYRILLFGIRKFNEIHIAFYQGVQQKLYPLKTLKYTFNKNYDLKLMGNVGFQINETIEVTKAENYRFVFKSFKEQPKIINWLKTININRPEYN